MFHDVVHNEDEGGANEVRNVADDSGPEAAED